MASRGRVAGAPRAAPPHAPALNEEARYQSRRRWSDATPIRWARRHPNTTAAALLALFVGALLWPALIGAKILSPSALLYGMPPWEPYRPSAIGDYVNTLLSDVPMADYPWRLLARELIHSGTFPAWNPHNFAGVPLFNNPQVGLFSALNLPLWLLPLDYALGLSAAVKLWFGGFGAYLLVQQLRLGFLPGLLAGVSFAFCSLNIVWLTHETLPAVAVTLPWALWLVERNLARGQLGSVLALAAVVATGLGGGHPGMQVHLLAAIALYAILRATTLREPSVPERLRRLAAIGGGVALGVLVMGAMLVPELVSSRGTLGTIARAPERSTLPGAEMPFDAIRSVVTPDWWGRPSSVEVLASEGSAGSINYNERTFYAGVVALLLALVALVSTGRWRAKAPFVVLVVLGLAVPLHAPGIYWLVTHLPGFELVQNQRMHFVFELAVALLAAFGLRAVLDAPRAHLRRLAIPVAAIALGVVLFAETRPTSADVSALVDHFTGSAPASAPGAVVEENSSAGRVIMMISTVWLLAFAVGVGLALLAVRRWPRQVAAVGCGLVLLAALDMVRFARGYQPMGPAADVIPPVTPAIEFLQRHRDEGRFVGMRYALLNDYALRFGLDDIRGYDPPQPTVRFFRLWRIANPRQSNWQTFGIDELTPAALNVISLLGARFVVTGFDLDLQGQRGFGALQVVYAGHDAVVYRNDRAVARAALARDVTIVTDERAARAAMAVPAFDPRRTAIVEQSEPGAAALARGKGPTGSVRLIEERNARVTLEARLDRRGLVVLNDNLTDGWSVEVDGRPADIVRVNSVMRGVIVDPGTHEVVWSYAVPGLRLGAVLTVAGLALFATGGAVLLSRRRRR